MDIFSPDKPCDCCNRCQRCLDYLYAECCSCVGLCPHPSATELAAIPESVVFTFSEEKGEVVPSLWESLTETSDSRWDPITYPVDIPPTKVKGSAAVTAKLKLMPSSSSSSPDEVDAMMLGKDSPAQLVTVNCTVVFQTEQMGKHKCRSNCVSMGATSGRYFRDGCCECVGHNCQNYGVDQSR